MRPTSQEALALLNQLSETPNNGIVCHCVCVGDTAATIAAALQSKSYDLDVDQVRALGYLHDVGRLLGPGDEHIVNGYRYLKDHGFATEYYNTCLTHSFPENHPLRILCTSPRLLIRDESLIDFLEKYEYTLTDKIIILSDLMCNKRVHTIDHRMIDAISRHGTWEGTQECVLAVRRLKQYFDDLLGHNLYDLFPEIRENL